MLTPKFGTEGSLICGSNLVKNPVQQRIRQRLFAVGRLLPFGKGTICADFARSHGDVARAEGMNGWINIRIWALN
jgi:hypothetical protein